VANLNKALQHSQAHKRWLKQNIGSIHLFIQTREKTNHNILTFRVLIFFSPHSLLYSLYCVFSLSLYLNMLIYTSEPRLLSRQNYILSLFHKTTDDWKFKDNYDKNEIRLAKLLATLWHILIAQQNLHCPHTFTSLLFPTPIPVTEGSWR